MACLPLIIQSERHKRIGLALTVWLQMCTVASWFLVTLCSIHSLHTYRPRIRSYILGALDGTHIKIRVPTVDKLRYRMRKGDIATNTLGVCTPDMHFVYVLPGWEGSVVDGRVLRDVISCYYLIDAGYTNCEGFLAPFRGQRYHLNEWHQGY
ncbi:hypothetical protein Gotur_029173 [Gossypium turneri]